MITYTVDGERVKIEMSRGDYDTLILALGYAAGAAKKQGWDERFWGWIHFANELNRQNPSYTPYEIPLEFWRDEWGLRP